MDDQTADYGRGEANDDPDGVFYIAAFQELSQVPNAEAEIKNKQRDEK